MGEYIESLPTSFLPSSSSFSFFFCLFTILGFKLRAPLEHVSLPAPPPPPPPPNPFNLFFLYIGSHTNFCLELAWVCESWSYPSCITGILGMHCHAWLVLLIEGLAHFALASFNSPVSASRTARIADMSHCALLASFFFFFKVSPRFLLVAFVYSPCLFFVLFILKGESCPH
jgi:hypothetical protein